MAQRDLITIGVIIAPHGVRGDVRIMAETDFPERFLQLESCYIGGTEMHVTSARFHKQFVLVTFEEVKNREEAQLLRGQEVQVLEEDLVPLPEGTYYIYQLIGFSVVNQEGTTLGTLKDILQTGANDVYVVDTGEKEDLLLPNIESVILEIDMDGKCITVDPPEWM